MAAFVSGGFLPENVRGRKIENFIVLSDWYVRGAFSYDYVLISLFSVFVFFIFILFTGCMLL